MARAKAERDRGEIWIVGASQGLGLEMARLWRARGAQVTGMARRPAPAGAFDRYAQIDVRDEASVEGAIGALYAAGAAPRIVLCCASVLSQGSLIDRPEAALRAELDTNYLGFVRLCRALAKFKPADQRVRVAAIGSTLGYVGCPSTDNYSASKAALISFARSARVELAPLGIELVILSPPHMTNGADLIGPQPFTVAWSARRLIAAAERGRREYLLGASNRLMMRMSRYAPGLAQSIMNAIGRDALKRGAAAQRPALN